MWYKLKDKHGHCLIHISQTIRSNSTTMKFKQEMMMMKTLCPVHTPFPKVIGVDRSMVQPSKE